MTASAQLRNTSAQGKALLKGLMEKNPSKRYSARQALRDPWFDNLNIELNEHGRVALDFKFCKKILWVKV